jgi:hypothetical protein
MSARAEALHRIDTALAELGALEACLTAARRGQWPGADRGDVARRFQAIADAGQGHHAFAPVQELASMAGKATADLEVVQHAADVLSLLLRDMGHQLLGRRGADVTPAVRALRERLEHTLVAASR